MPIIICSFLYALLLFLSSAKFLAHAQEQGPKYFQTPVHEILQHEVYLATNENQEVVISYASKGVDLRPNDYVTHADGVRILSGGLDSFFKTGEKEVVVPIVDDSNTKYNGNKLLGFVLMQLVTPRKLSTRRGEIFYDFEEGGNAPTMNLGKIR